MGEANQSIYIDFYFFAQPHIVIANQNTMPAHVGVAFKIYGLGFRVRQPSWRPATFLNQLLFKGTGPEALIRFFMRMRAWKKVHPICFWHVPVLGSWGQEGLPKVREHARTTHESPKPSPRESEILPREPDSPHERQKSSP